MVPICYNFDLFASGRCLFDIAIRLFALDFDLFAGFFAYLPGVVYLAKTMTPLFQNHHFCVVYLVFNFKLVKSLFPASNIFTNCILFITYSARQWDLGTSNLKNNPICCAKQFFCLFACCPFARYCNLFGIDCACLAMVFTYLLRLWPIWHDCLLICQPNRQIYFWNFLTK